MWHFIAGTLVMEKGWKGTPEDPCKCYTCENLNEFGQFAQFRICCCLSATAELMVQ